MRPSHRLSVKFGSRETSPVPSAFRQEPVGRPRVSPTSSASGRVRKSRRVAEPELEILEAVYLMRPCGIADGVRDFDDRLQAVGDAVPEPPTDGRAPLVREAGMAPPT